MGTVLQVGNLAADVTTLDLLLRFGDFGIVESASIDRDGADGPGARFARVLMLNEVEAQAAIDWLHDTDFQGRTISVMREPGRSKGDFWLHLDLPR